MGLYEYHYRDEAYVVIQDTVWFGQQFTVGAVGPNENNTLATIHIKGYRLGNPGLVIVEVYNIEEVESMPDGSPISTGSFDGDAIGTETQTIEVPMTPVQLLAGTMYVIVISARDGSAGNSFQWKTSLPPCFLAGTEILMSDGTVKTIEHIRKGDRILGYDMVKMKTATVTETAKHRSTVYYRLTFEDGKTLEATGNHPIHRNEGYIPVEQLIPGDEITTWQNNTLTTCRVLTIERKETTVDTYNITVEDTHNYIAQNRLVHNK